MSLTQWECLGGAHSSDKYVFNKTAWTESLLWAFVIIVLFKIYIYICKIYIYVYIYTYIYTHSINNRLCFSHSVMVCVWMHIVTVLCLWVCNKMLVASLKLLSGLWCPRHILYMVHSCLSILRFKGALHWKPSMISYSVLDAEL